MQKLVIITAACLTLATAAHAKCGTNQLNGNWHLYRAGGDVYAVSIQGGTMSLLEPPGLAYPIAQNEKCKVTSTIDGLLLSGTSEAIPSGSNRKPRSIDLSIAVPAPFHLKIVRR